MKQALLAVSFGTTVEEARALDLAGVERAVRRAAPELPFARTYTSPMVRRILMRRGEKIQGLEEALEGLGRLPQIQALYQRELERLRKGAAGSAL